MSTALELEADYELVTSSAADGAARLLSAGRGPRFLTALTDVERFRSAGRPSQEPRCDWTRVALHVATDLGPEFSSEQPHTIAERGQGWFDEP